VRRHNDSNRGRAVNRVLTAPTARWRLPPCYPATGQSAAAVGEGQPRRLTAAQSARNTDAERQACEIRLRAERKAGQLLPKAIKKGQPGKERSSETTLLSDLGITKDQSSQWQKLGAISQKDFDLAIGESVKPPTTKGILRAITEPPRRTVPSDALWLWGRLLYLVHLISRNSFGLMTRKLSVTESQRSAQFRGTFSRRKLSVASANWAHVA
jgi:hypothetical protein